MPMPIVKRVCAAVVVSISGLLVTTVHAGSAGDLRAHHSRLGLQLAASPFQRPLLLESNGSATDPGGEVHAVLDQPFAVVAAALRRSDTWCDVMTLQTNVRRCEVSGDATSPTLTVAVVRRFDQPVGQAYPVAFRQTVTAATADYLHVQLNAPVGPLGTSDYRLGLEAAPLDGERSIVRMRYGYTHGLAARLATDAYLATSGRDKVGFSVVGQDTAGAPVYVGGLRGVAERNTMRYYLAIEAVLDSLAAPAALRTEQRQRRWFAAIERYPRQLREMALPEYLALKRQDHG